MRNDSGAPPSFWTICDAILVPAIIFEPVEIVERRRLLAELQPRLRKDDELQRHDLVEFLVEQAGLVEPPQRGRGDLGIGGREIGQRRDLEQRELAGKRRQTPADLHHVAGDLVIDVALVRQRLAVEHLDPEEAVRLLVDLLGPGMMDADVEMRLRHIERREFEHQLVGRGARAETRDRSGREPSHHAARFM